jgi:pimeloyl-ACP methyl ester carboxylesterase
MSSEALPERVAIAAKHATADVAPGVALHYVDTEAGDQPVVLLHGFPETSHEWTRMIPRIASGSRRIIAPDYRGAGASSKPVAGYDKATMAADLRCLLRERLRITQPVVLVGHDIGGIIAVVYALEYRGEVSHVVAIDTILPGTAVFDRMRGDPRGWHAAFHSARDIAELLVQGRERAYLRHMIDVRIFDPSAITPADFDVYLRAYEAPGAMRAAFELYRAFDDDARAIRGAVDERGKITAPVLAVGGERSGLGAAMPDMLREVAENVSVVTIPRTGHWIPEESPNAFADAVLGFLDQSGTSTAPPSLFRATRPG